ncbi:MAG: hypothetical protein HY650_12425 [Acidobacteria bacterium]|nr:hypothetical protein [Acidobacteriota bacterium]
MQTATRSRFLKPILAFLVLAASLAPTAFAKRYTKPTVVVIRAEWCSTCQKLEPTMNDLMNEYGDRLNFVVLDVTSEESTAASAATARRLGIGRFFQTHQQRTSTVAVFGKGNRVLYQAVANFDRGAYVRAFNQAIAQAGKGSKD